MGGQHLGVVHDLTLVGGDLQRCQHIINTRKAGGGAGWGAVETPLENVEARPACYVGALFEERKPEGSISISGGEGLNTYKVSLKLRRQI